MRGFAGKGGMGGFGRLGYLADGTPVVTTPTGPVAIPPSAAAALAQAATPNGVPSQAGGGNVQGRGLYFTYQTPVIASIAPGAATAVTIQFDQNSVFNWLRTTFTVDKTNAAQTSSTQPIPFVTLQITDTGNGMSFMNGPIPIYAMAGLEGNLPYVLPTPQLVQANASYQFQWASYSTGGGGNETYTNLRLQLHGYRIFNVGSANAS
jgi:hypothetical protein